MNEDLEKLRGDRKLSFKELIKRSLPYFKPEVWWILLAMFIVVINVALAAILPLIVQYYVDYLQQDASVVINKGLHVSL